MVDSAAPSRNPANSVDGLSGAFREILGKFLQGSIDDMLPAKIIGFDRTANRVTIQPLIAVVRTDDVHVSRNQYVSIPVLNIGGGGCILSFNLVAGDLGWIKANDRDISDFLKSYSESVPSTKRIHAFDNGVFIPDVMTGYTINAEDASNAVLQTTDGTVRISLFPSKLKITTPELEVVAPIVTETSDTIVITATTSVTVNAPAITHTGAEIINGSLVVNGPLTATGPTVLAGVTSNGINIGDTHTHAQGNDSDGDTQVNTGPPM